MTYQYEPLLPGRIRLLELRSISPLIGKVITGTLDSQYNTLSYCWGTTERSECILVDGKSLAITEQLRDALVTVPRTSPLWVDQICIDQENEVEKSKQVSMMVSIYTNTTWTFAFLGRDTRHVALAIEKLSYGAEPEWNNDLQWFIMYLGRHPYFSRMWIIQECHGTTKEKLRFVYGSLELSWQQIVTLQGHFRTAYSQLDDFGDGYDLVQASQRFKAFGDVLMQPRLSSDELILKFFPYMQCTDSRDRFFALHNMASDREQLPAIDYTKTAREVYMEHSTHLLDKMGSAKYLAFLLLFDTVPQDDVPSWCPRVFDAANLNTEEIVVDEEDIADGDLGTYASREGDTLRVSGVIVDTIRDLDLDGLQSYEDETPFQRKWGRLTNFFAGAGSQAAMLLTLEAFRLLFVHTTKKMSTEDQQHFFRLIPSDEKSWMESYTEAVNRSISLELDRTEKSASPHWQILVTEKCHVGVGSTSAKAGDVIAVIAGIRQPVVLRPTGSVYRLLSKCRLLGFMHGEATEQEDAQLRASTEGILLC